MIKSKKPKILFYDIETSPLLAYVWGTGKQVIRHEQFKKGSSRYGIICITYCFNDGKPAKAIGWGFDKQDTASVVKEFDKIARTADVIIGKNNHRFDNKHLSAQRMFHDLDGFPDFLNKSDDLETHMRRQFYLPSQSLDYISNELGLGGKIKMRLDDWVQIVEKKDIKAYERMLKYGKKDVVDTRTIWNYCSKHFKPKLNQATFKKLECCTNCGSTNIVKDGTVHSGGSTYQKFRCNDHKGYAGKQLKEGGKILI